METAATKNLEILDYAFGQATPTHRREIATAIRLIKRVYRIDQQQRHLNAVFNAKTAEGKLLSRACTHVKARGTLVMVEREHFQEVYHDVTTAMLNPETMLDG